MAKRRYHVIETCIHDVIDELKCPYFRLRSHVILCIVQLDKWSVILIVHVLHATCEDEAE